jgi:hypothetical protein
MPESGTYGSVRGVPSNGHPYRDQAQTQPAHISTGLDHDHDHSL